MIELDLDKTVVWRCRETANALYTNEIPYVKADYCDGVTGQALIEIDKAGE